MPDEVVREEAAPESEQTSPGDEHPWMDLWPVYNLVLTVIVLLMLPRWVMLLNVSFLSKMLMCAAVANLCYLAGPAVQMIPRCRGKGWRRVLFGLGTAFATLVTAVIMTFVNSVYLTPAVEQVLRPTGLGLTADDYTDGMASGWETYGVTHDYVVRIARIELATERMTRLVTQLPPSTDVTYNPWSEAAREWPDRRPPHITPSEFDLFQPPPVGVRLLEVAYVADGIVTNHLYSVAAITDSSGNVEERYTYDAYGKMYVRDSAGALKETGGVMDAPMQPYGFTGRRYDDESGLYYFRARYYDDQLGRFISRDPIGYVDGMSLYSAYYVPNHTDPSGQGIKDMIEWILDTAKARNVSGQRIQRAVEAYRANPNLKTCDNCCLTLCEEMADNGFYPPACAAVYKACYDQCLAEHAGKEKGD